ncbi:hypothetical protein COV82_05400 [Candidatus Peregrinibacteria bacterium CG11_big_fil_rev_8_21_14_0_20_46_8]|nr:MAG: hypothetical protein COV82_05400 [Candidatus Peregrinibacteria bacterium CG11_big_fil_rev_8_21_14_0_20_46_8]
MPRTAAISLKDWNFGLDARLYYAFFLNYTVLLFYNIEIFVFARELFGTLQFCYSTTLEFYFYAGVVWDAAVLLHYNILIFSSRGNFIRWLMQAVSELRCATI